jgi:8-oxo-dGTP pyrophosphatase MutT (NUDIX family)
MNFPVSIKGVLVEAGRVVLLENERDEWELPGGRLEPGEAPETCLAREFAEELGAVVEVTRIIDCWLYEVLPQREVVIITYGVKRSDEGELRVSHEHRRFWVIHTSRNRNLADIGRLPPFNMRMVRKPRSAPVKLRRD